jgi:serine/threonine-protein kinase
MAEIFLALQEGPEGFSRRLVIKRILPHLAADKAFLQMFLDEARIVAMLSHPHIVHLYDFGEVEGSYYLAMEYVEGIDLKLLGDRIGPVPAEHAAKIMSYVCEGLSHAHELVHEGRRLGLVHRDVTPSNILISYDGSVKVADFGIAKTYSGDDRTRAGVVKGKFAYLSPEQARGLPLDHRSDQFNIGILLYELLTGVSLFPHDSFQRAMRAIMGGEIESPERIQSTIPPRLAAIVMRALARRRDDRYPDTLALRADLESFLREWPAPSDAVVIGSYVRVAFADRPSPHHTPAGVPPQGTASLAGGTASVAAGPVVRVTRTAAAAGATPEVAPAGGPPRMPPPVLASTRRESRFTGRAPDDEDEEESGLGVALAAEDDEDATRTVAGLHDEPTDLHGALGGGILPEGDADEAGLIEEGTATTTIAAPDTKPSQLPSAWDVGQNRRRRRTIALSASVGLAAALGTTAALLWTGGAPASPDEAPAAPPLSARPVPRAVQNTDLRVSSSPAGARIAVDGEATAYLTPSVLTVPGSTEHRVALTRDGYRPVERVVPASPGAIVTVDLILEPDGTPVGAAPDGGTAVAGGQELPPALEAPDGGAIPRGPPGRRGGKRGTSGERGTGPHESPDRGGTAMGYLSVDTMPWSKVYLGGRLLGTTPLGNVRVPAGRHSLRLVNPESGERTIGVTIVADQTKRVSLSL